jgi:RecA/RadA recombinase
MKNNRFTHESTLTPANISVVHIARPDIIVSSGIPELDGLCGGFKAGELTVVDGNSGRISDLPNQLCVNTCANPYRIAQYARMHELNQQDVLQNVVISRAFTVYQLSTIIQELLEPMTQKRNPRTLIVGMLPVLYLDSEISTREAQTLLSQDLEKLQQLTTKYNLITVCTNLDVMPLASSKGIGKTLYDYANEIVRMKQFEQCTALELVKQGKHATIIHGAAGQLRLEAFGMVS